MKRILFLDDHEKWHRLADRDISRFAECSIDHAYSIAEAVALWQTNNYALVVTDINLDINSPSSRQGLDILVKNIRNSGSMVPIVCISANKGLEAIALESGADRFVAKSGFYPDFINAAGAYLK